MPDERNEDWRPGCPDCAHLREELAEARDVATHFRNELADLRAEMRAAVVGYETQLRVQGEYHVALVAGLRRVLDAASDPMDVYGPAMPALDEATIALLSAPYPQREG